tara:strand:+ start:25217 stop:25645 length:429 start_codon:yes stop_codon:yes gene_type:complete
MSMPNLVPGRHMVVFDDGRKGLVLENGIMYFEGTNLHELKSTGWNLPNRWDKHGEPVGRYISHSIIEVYDIRSNPNLLYFYTKDDEFPTKTGQINENKLIWESKNQLLRQELEDKSKKLEFFKAKISQLECYIEAIEQELNK